MKNTTKILFISCFIVHLLVLWFLFVWSFVMFAVTYSGGFLDEELEISLVSKILINILNLATLSFGVLLAIDMGRALFKKSGINKKQLQRTLCLFLGSLALVTANYILLQNGISIFG